MSRNILVVLLLSLAGCTGALPTSTVSQDPEVARQEPPKTLAIWQVSLEEANLPVRVEIQPRLSTGVKEGLAAIFPVNAGGKGIRFPAAADDPPCSNETRTVLVTLIDDAGRPGDSDWANVVCGDSRRGIVVSILEDTISVEQILLSSCDKRGERHYPESDCARIEQRRIEDQGRANGTLPPNIGFSQRSATKSVQITSADTGTEWNTIRATVTCSAGTPGLKRGVAEVPLADGVADPIHAVDDVNAGEVLAVTCSETVGGTIVSLALRHKPSDKPLGSTYTFTY